MKQKDIALIVVIVFITGIVSWIVANMFFNSSAKRSEKVPVVAAISKEFPDVKNDHDYKSIFNPKALDPTLPIEIGDSKNDTPFNQ